MFGFELYLIIVKLTVHSNLYVDSRMVNTKTQNLKESLQNVIINWDRENPQFLQSPRDITSGIIVFNTANILITTPGNILIFLRLLSPLGKK